MQWQKFSLAVYLHTVFADWRRSSKTTNVTTNLQLKYKLTMLLTSHQTLILFLADRTIGRAFATACRLSVSLSVVCLWRFVFWRNGTS